MGSIGVVINTNVYISALGLGGTPLEALLRTFSDDVNLLASEATLAELDRVMQYDRLPFTQDDREGYLAILSREIELVVPESDVNVIERDPADNAFLSCAVEGDARYLVSDDNHLLDLGSYRGIDIVSPREFITRID